MISFSDLSTLSKNSNYNKTGFSRNENDFFFFNESLLQLKTAAWLRSSNVKSVIC